MCNHTHVTLKRHEQKHASQKQVVSFTTIPPTLSLITACICIVPITCLPASHARSFWTFGHYNVDLLHMRCIFCLLYDFLYILSVFNKLYSVRMSKRSVHGSQVDRWWGLYRYTQLLDSVRLYFQLFVWGSSLFYAMCVCLRIVVANTYCVVFFVFVCLVFCVPYVASFSGLSIFYCSFGILWRLLDCAVNFPSLTNWSES
jgi:hypothetical protein